MARAGSLPGVMRRIFAITTLALLGLLLLASVPAVAQEEGSTSETVVDEATTDTVLDYKTPAVSIVEVPEESLEQPWTIRYLVPTMIVLGGALVFGTVVQYFLKVVRPRYKTVE